MTDVEDTLHALFACDGSSELTLLREGLRRKCDLSGEFRGGLRGLTPNDILQQMLVSKQLVATLAEYAYNFVQIVEKVPMFVASEAYWFG